MDLHTAGVLGAVFGLSNLFARALGGITSDLVARKYGMRGRLWNLWIVQTLGGWPRGASAALTPSLPARRPQPGRARLPGPPPASIPRSSRAPTDPAARPASLALSLCPPGGVCSIAMFYCDSSLGLTMMVVAFWSIFVPMGCGASYGIAPFITRRGLGVASGLIGAGGNAGSAVTQALFFTGTNMSTAEGFKWMVSALLAQQRRRAAGARLSATTPASAPASASTGPARLLLAAPCPLPTLPAHAHPPPPDPSSLPLPLPQGVMIIAVTATLVTIHFPMWGGMLTRGNPDITEEEYYRCVPPACTACSGCPYRAAASCAACSAPGCHPLCCAVLTPLLPAPPPVLPSSLPAAATTRQRSGSRACTAPSSTGPPSRGPTAASRISWPSCRPTSLRRPTPPPPSEGAALPLAGVSWSRPWLRWTHTNSPPLASCPPTVYIFFVCTHPCLLLPSHPPRPHPSSLRLPPRCEAPRLPLCLLWLESPCALPPAAPLAPARSMRFFSLN